MSMSPGLRAIYEDDRLREEVQGLLADAWLWGWDSLGDALEEIEAMADMAEDFDMPPAESFRVQNPFVDDPDKYGEVVLNAA